MNVVYRKTTYNVIEIFGEYLIVQNELNGEVITLSVSDLDAEIVRQESNIISIEGFRQCQKRKTKARQKKQIV